jgi:DNA mismatch endonuclease (patch repair protein)
MMPGMKNTKPEIMIRKEIFTNGFKSRLHNEKLPGKPDLVFRKYNAVVFIHGCFWHGHNCRYFVWPKPNYGILERKDRWQQKE